MAFIFGILTTQYTRFVYCYESEPTIKLTVRLILFGPLFLFSMFLHLIFWFFYYWYRVIFTSETEVSFFK